MPHCLPVLASYLQIQASLLQSVKSDLETTKQQLQQAIGKFFFTFLWLQIKLLVLHEWGFFLRAFKDKSRENVLKSTGKTITLWKHSPERREQLQKIARNIKYF